MKLVIMCPSLSRYPVPPKDQPGCELIECPHCFNQCWISAKKKAIKGAAKEYFLACYDCLEKKAKEEPEFFCNSCRINI